MIVFCNVQVLIQGSRFLAPKRKVAGRGFGAVLALPSAIWRATRHRDNRQAAEHRIKALAAWSCDFGVNSTFVLVLMPLVFVVMSMRGLIRILQVMTATVQPAQIADNSWEEVKGLYMAQWNEDISSAMTFQYMAVFVFAQFCTFALEEWAKRKTSEQQPSEDTEKEERRLLVNISLLAVYAFVFIGVVKGIVDISLAIASTHKGLGDAALQMQDTVSLRVDPILGFATVLAMVNMYFLGKMRGVKNFLGEQVNTKFTATRMLLLFGQLQMTGLKMATNEYAKRTDSHMMILVRHVLPHWYFTQEMAMLLHSTLLPIECLVISIFNLHFWDLPIRVKTSEEGDGLDGNLIQHPHEDRDQDCRVP
jgi:hypothetical protein